MASCVAFGCSNTKKIPGISFHRFPKDEALKLAWILAVRRKDWVPTQASRLCSEHFVETDFDRASTLRVYLKKDAVPSVFKAFPKHLQTKTKSPSQEVYDKDRNAAHKNDLFEAMHPI